MATCTPQSAWGEAVACGSGQVCSTMADGSACVDQEAMGGSGGMGGAGGEAGADGSGGEGGAEGGAGGAGGEAAKVEQAAQQVQAAQHCRWCRRNVTSRRKRWAAACAAIKVPRGDVRACTFRSSQ